VTIKTIQTCRLALVAAIATSLAWLPACGRSTDDDAAAVKTTLESFYAAMKNAENATAMALIAEDAVFVESGRLETREQYEKNHLPSDISFEKQVTGKRGEWDIKIKDDTAWAITTTEYDGIFDGGPVNFTSAQLAVLTRDTDKWMIRSIHWSSRR
jgi:ketosteroid isomerase-like protein